MSRKRKAIFIGSLVITVLAIPPLFLYVYLPFIFSGGLEGMRKRRIPAPDLKNLAIISRRTSMKNGIEATFKVLDTSPGFTRYAIATHDQCYQGETNWKIVDSYAHRCEFRATRFYGFNGDFQEQMIKFETLLNHNGWTSPNDSSIQSSFTDYNDLCGGYPVSASGGDRSRKYLVSDLCASGPYRKNGLAMVIAYAEKETDDLIRLNLIQKVYTSPRGTIHNVQELQDVKTVFGEITRSCRYVLGVSIDGTYFEN
ncbi:MAG: hypothetical protein J2P41_03065 [Blastocatellia bacterium]|nr:hypothetical protein [Blastocatellia bacterium]